MNQALVIVDAQRGFMPPEEGKRALVPGFGELAVPDGQMVVEPLNKLTAVFRDNGLIVATTGDAHKPGTAHISETPNFVDTWPEHCMEDTAGAELHPELIAGHGIAKHFTKGDVVAATPADDDSYTGALAHRTDEATGGRILLPDYLRANGVSRTFLGGLALGDGEEHPLCVDSTAIDFHQQGFEVVVVTDAAKPVVPENQAICYRNLAALGIELATSDEVIQEITASRVN